MKANQRNVAVGFAAGMVLGAVVLTSLGQDSSKPKAGVSKAAAAAAVVAKTRTFTVPRYSVQFDSSQRLLLITDNAYSQLYLYDTAKSGASTLKSRIDLRQTGARQLRGVLSGASGKPQQKKAAKKPAARKPSAKKPAGKTG
jgi:hypothetical protein